MRTTATLAAFAALAVPATAVPTSRTSPSRQARRQGGLHAEEGRLPRPRDLRLRRARPRPPAPTPRGAATTATAASSSSTVNKANHKGAKGEQTFTLDQRPRAASTRATDTTPAAGDRVKVHGKVTSCARSATPAGFTPTVTVRKVDIKAPKAQGVQG